MEVDAEKLIALAESAEQRAGAIHVKYQTKRDLAQTARSRRLVADAIAYEKIAANLLNDFFYWSGKATSYRGVVAMAELATIVEDELDAEGSCP